MNIPATPGRGLASVISLGGLSPNGFLPTVLNWYSSLSRLSMTVSWVSKWFTHDVFTNSTSGTAN